MLCGQTQTLALPENVRLLKAAGVVFQHVCVMLMLHGASAEPQPGWPLSSSLILERLKAECVCRGHVLLLLCNNGDRAASDRRPKKQKSSGSCLGGLEGKKCRTNLPSEGLLYC